MKGIANYYKAGEIEIKALQAGNDVLLLPESVGTAISSIKTAIDSNLVSLDELNIKCKKVLSYILPLKPPIKGFSLKMLGPCSI